MLLMSMKDCCTPNENGSSVTVKVDVTRIVKYLCVSGIFIVGIIFGTKCYQKMLQEGLFNQK
jgi:hypothetical protein